MASTWSEVATEVGRWQQALLKEGLTPGDRVAVMLRNCREWVVFDQACAGLGLVSVPLARQEWVALARELELDPDSPEDLNSRFVEKTLRARLSRQLKEFPGYAQVRRLAPQLEPWTLEDGLLTPTMKMKRARILKRFAPHIEALYECSGD